MQCDHVLIKGDNLDLDMHMGRILCEDWNLLPQAR